MSELGIVPKVEGSSEQGTGLGRVEEEGLGGEVEAGLWVELSSSWDCLCRLC